MKPVYVKKWYGFLLRAIQGINKEEISEAEFYAGLEKALSLKVVQLTGAGQ